MLRVCKFSREHIDHLKLMFEFSDAGRKALVENKEMNGYSLFDQDEVIGIGGIHNIWSHVGEAWLLLGEYAMAKPTSVARHTAYMFDHLQEEFEYKRIQASIAVTDKRARRFAEWLGFQNEGVMKKYGPDGTDYYRYARVT